MNRILLLAAAGFLAVPPAASQSATADRCVPSAGLQARREPLNRRQAADSVRAAARKQVLDSLRADVNDAARQAGIDAPAGLIVLEVRGRRGERTVIHPWRTNVPEELIRASVERRGARLVAVTEGVRTVHLRLDRLAPAADPLAVECMPRPENLDAFRAELERIGKRALPQPPGSNPMVSVNLRMLVSREGEVAYATISSRGSSGALDTAILEAARRLRFLPASVHGTPIEVWVEQPVQLEVPVRPAEEPRP